MVIKAQPDVLPNIQIENEPHAAPFVLRLFERGVGVSIVKSTILTQLEHIQGADLDGGPFSRWVRAIHDCTELSEANVRMLGVSPTMYFGHWLRTGSGRSLPPRPMRAALLLSLAQGAFLGYRRRPAPNHLRRWAEIRLPEGVERDSPLPNRVSRALFWRAGYSYADLFVNLYPFNDQIGFAQFLWRHFGSEIFSHDQADAVMDRLVEEGVTCPTFVKLPPIPGGWRRDIDLFTRLDHLSGMPRRIGQLLLNRKLHQPARLMRFDGHLTDVNGFGSSSVNTICTVMSDAGFRVTDFHCLR